MFDCRPYQWRWRTKAAMDDLRWRRAAPMMAEGGANVGEDKSGRWRKGWVVHDGLLKASEQESKRHQWSSGRIVPCHGTDPGSIPGWIVDHPYLFTIELRHGGKFTLFPNVIYVKGKLTYIDLVDIDEFSVHELNAMMLELGYMVPPVIYYHFRIPNEDLIFGLRALGNDQDVCNLAKYTGANKVIQVYTEHGTTNLVTYFMSPNKRNSVVIEELNEEDEVAIELKQRKQKLVHDPQHESCSSSLPLVVYGDKEAPSSEIRDKQDKEAPSSVIRDNQDKEAPSSVTRDNQDKEAPLSVTRDNQDKGVQQKHELDAKTVYVPIGLSEMLNVDFDPFEGLHDSDNNNKTDPTTIHLGSDYQEFDQDNGGLFDGQADEFN
ncbi:unnamed protein product [Lactuca saligna]|uniref:PB1-like domain-containing protein n=1 Tax=Lactuca saligna TaxID=75948 RepID=A0AA35Y4Y3_LACSI|nr:unnamed protein product [Lactuca saligna]